MVEVKSEANKDGSGKGQWSAWKASLRLLPLCISAEFESNLELFNLDD